MISRVSEFVLLKMLGEQLHKLEGVAIMWAVTMEVVLNSKSAVQSGLYRGV